ncbi:MAG: Glycine--tRNA ligase [Parcubacteria bacterium OLB19]|nr:MAG: Glycine--tRNA ligase [Parcubacteria bacterium OLB19]
MEKIVSLCKRRGFVFQGSEIYGGLKGTWDFGPLGVTLNNNIKREWWKMFVDGREDMYGLDAAILMNAKVWEASGHTGAGFCDPLVEDLETGERYRADHLLKDNGLDAEGMSLADIDKIISEKGIKSPKGNSLSPARQFNLMFETTIGATAGPDGKVYLRPETAQGIFVNFKNVLDSMAPKMPFGIGQIGKAFRNEIAPREYLFRVREFEQMEIEYFVKEEEWVKSFEEWRVAIWKWFDHLGLKRENVREYEVPANDLAHYSKRTIDFEYDFPGKGFDELAGFAYRTDHDLKNHMKASGVTMEYIEADGSRYIPHVIEPSFGVGRALTAVLSEAYTEDEMNGEVRTYLKLPVHLAPFRVAVSPLLKNKPELVTKAREVFAVLKKEFGNVAFDDNGNIGKRYRRQDEIGTPYCVVIDFETLGEEKPELKDTVTVRDRDTGEQTRVKIAELVEYLK